MRTLAVAKIKNLSAENKKEITKKDGSIDFCNVPTIMQAGGMSHECLILVLRLCPASDYFGSPKVILNTKTFTLRKTRSLVNAMIKKVTLDLIEEIPEVPSLPSS